MMIRRPLAVLALLAAAPAVAQTASPASAPASAQDSACAVLPESGPVATPGPNVVVTPVPMGDRRLHCPDDFRLDVTGRMPQCVKPGITVADGSPRAVCYAALPFGPLAAIPPRSRPTRTCPAPVTTTVIRLQGANVGAADAIVSIIPADGIEATTLTATGSDVGEAENPVLQNCFAFACRLVRLDIRASAAAEVRVRVALPGQDAIEERLKLPEYCPR